MAFATTALLSPTSLYGRSGTLRPFDWSHRVAGAGLVALAVTYGPARIAYGMFLPELRETFSLSAAAAGGIASAAYAGYIVTLLAASILTRAWGAKLPVLLGCCLASLGLAAVSWTTSPLVMMGGVVVAMAASGLSWTPYNAAVDRVVRRPKRAQVLSVVSTGTTLGIAFMAVVGLYAGFQDLSWRMAWAGFAALGLAAAAVNFVVLPPSLRLRPRPAHRAARPVQNAGGTKASGVPWRSLLVRGAVPLVALSFAQGVGSAVFSAFGVDWVREAGGLDGVSDRAVGALVFLAYGLLGVTGFLTAVLERRLGLKRLLAAIFAALATACALLALAPATWAGALGAAGLFGAGVMTVSVVFAMWSMRVFPALPVIGFTVAIVAFALGGVTGPAAAGMLVDAAGIAMGTVFAAQAAVYAVMAATSLVAIGVEANEPSAV